MTSPLDAVVVDTNVLSWLLEGRGDPVTESYRSLIDSRPIVVPFQVVAEIRYGMQRAHWGDFRVRRTEQSLAALAIAQPDDETITVYARLRLWAAEQGHPLGHKVHDGDRWIAAVALRARRSLVSHDAVFKGIDGLDLLTSL